MFLTALELRADEVPDVWILDKPLIWCDPIFGRITVPVGFRTDLASTPLHIGSNGRSRRAATGHDGLSASARAHGLLDKASHDDFLRAAMIADGCPSWQAQAFYVAVRLFGGPAWRSDARTLGPEGTVLVDGDFDTAAHWQNWLATRNGPGK